MDRRPPYLAGLLLIAAVCGLVDAACFLGLGGVFAEIMTGNMLLLAFRIGTGRSFESVPVIHYVEALAAFVVGAFVGGRLCNGPEPVRRRRVALTVECGVVVGAAVLAAVTRAGPSGLARDVVIALLAAGMGLQNAILRRHGMIDVATNVMTLTFTGLVSESGAAGGDNRHWRRRAGSIGIFFVSAAAGAWLVRWSPAWPLAVAAALLVAASVVMVRAPDAPGA